MKTITLGVNADYVTFVSDEDYDFLMQWKWNFKISSGQYRKCVYARRSSGRTTILMHHVILIHRMGLDRNGLTGEHGDRNSLNNQRTNLSWQTQGYQNRNQTRWLKNSPEVECANAVGNIPF